MKKLFAFVSILLSLFLFAACNPVGDQEKSENGTPPEETAGGDCMNGGGDPYYPAEPFEAHSFRNVLEYDGWSTEGTTVLMSSPEELAAYRDSVSVMFETIANNHPLIAVLDALPSDYFETYYLVAIYQLENSGSIQVSVKRIYFDEGEVVVTLERRLPGPDEDGTCDICPWWFLVEFEASQKITSVRVETETF